MNSINNLIQVITVCRKAKKTIPKNHGKVLKSSKHEFEFPVMW